MRTSPLLVFSGLVVLTLTLAVSRAASVSPPERKLLDFKTGLDLRVVGTSDARVAPAARSPDALRIQTGQNEPWPGVTLKAPAQGWDLSAFSQVEVDVLNPGTNRVTVNCRIDNAGADGVNHCVTGSVTLEPGNSGKLSVPLTRTSPGQLSGKLFGMRGYPVVAGGPGTVEPARISQVILFVAKPAADHVFEVENLRATGHYVPPTAWTKDADPYLPFIDAFGQYKHKDWPGKVHSLTELQGRVEEEKRELAANPAPTHWNKYGGWTDGPQLKATGFFRTEKVDGKWWLIDPEGRLFFSQGIDCVRMRDTTPVEEREEWFESFPGQSTELKRSFLRPGYALKGHYAGRSPQCYSFAEANLQHKYGTNSTSAQMQTVHRRLRSWGLNTIGMWSDQNTFLLRTTAYVDAIGSHRARMIEGSEGYWGKFPDVWDPGFKEGLQEAMRMKSGTSANDPWCLGYFADNEMSWGDESSLGLAALRSPTNQAAKKVLIEDLKVHYGEIAKLNAAWATDHASWEALLQSTTPPDPKRAKADLEAFYSKTAETYFRTVRDAIKERAPRQLYLGCRFAWVNPRAAAAAAKYCDVVSYNLYQRDVSRFHFNGGADVPLIIGEFHFGALDRGMFHTGLVPVADQNARAKAYQEYVEGALRHPNFVGCHWFQYQDEPTTGRVYDEENYQIGFVDIADTPYREIVQAARDVGARMYQTRLGTSKTAKATPLLSPAAFKKYVDQFNAQDQELYPQQVPNAAAWSFLSTNMPLFECPDAELEQTYYFRWWTYRKHIKATPDGYIITEFLPSVPWAGKHNSISCAAGHHLYEGRWLRDPKYLDDYSQFWFRKGGSPRTYSFWAADAIYARSLVTGDARQALDLLPDLIANYEQWEAGWLDRNGLFWQNDGNDGMEVSIGGSGYRATINTYLFGDARAIAQLAEMAGQTEIAGRYRQKAEAIKQAVQTKLWDESAQFFKVLPRGTNSPLAEVRELHGLTPWYCHLPDPKYSVAWKQLTDPQGFWAPFGPTTAEQRHPRFTVSYEGHECQWNGPSWPYATAVTLTALANLLQGYPPTVVGKTDYLRLLKTYAASHQLRRDDGTAVPWIDENLNPFTGDWLARTRLKTWSQGTWSSDKGGVERGKDYNHSTFCDLIITGLIGLRPSPGDSFVVNPLLPENTWDYFCLDRVPYHGKTLTIAFDRTGQRYGRGAGLRVYVDGEEVANRPDLGRLEARLGAPPTPAATEATAGWQKSPSNPVPNALGYATSPDGVHWTKAAGNPVFRPDPMNPWEQERVTACHVVRQSDWHVMFYIGFRDVDHAQIGVARSRDGITGWERHPQNPILRPGIMKWDHDAVYKPYAILDGDRWQLWYNGRYRQVEQIGLATHAGVDLGF